MGFRLASSSRELRNPARRAGVVLARLTIPVLMALVPALVDSSALAADPKPGEGLVVFSRENALKGKAIRFNVMQDGRPIGQLLAGTTIEVPLAPGSYTFTVRAPSLDGSDSITVAVQAGKVYQVEGKVLWGWPTGRPQFVLRSESASATSPAQARPSSSDALAGPALGAVVADPPAEAGAQATSSVADLRSFVGDWDLKMWSLAADGTKLEGRGTARGEARGTTGAEVVFTEFEAAAFPEATGGGRVLIENTANGGLTLESDFRHSEKALRFFGRFDADAGKLVFYPLNPIGGRTATGVPLTAVRVEIRAVDEKTWSAEAYSILDGQPTQVQSYRFTRR